VLRPGVLEVGDGNHYYYYYYYYCYYHHHHLLLLLKLILFYFSFVFSSPSSYYYHYHYCHHKTTIPVVVVLSSIQLCVVTVANGSDNLSVYVPLFSTARGVEVVIILVVFYSMLLIWLGGTMLLVSIPWVRRGKR